VKIGCILQWQNIGISQIMAGFEIKSIGIGSISKKWYQCVTIAYYKCVLIGG